MLPKTLQNVESQYVFARQRGASMPAFQKPSEQVTWCGGPLKNGMHAIDVFGQLRSPRIGEDSLKGGDIDGCF